MRYIVTLNGGSSSVKFSLWTEGEQHAQVAVGKIDRLGADDCELIVETGGDSARIALGRADHAKGLDAIAEALTPLLAGGQIAGIGHRVVHGGPDFDAPAVLNDALLKDLEQYVPFAPLHQPYNLAGARAAMQAFPDAVQVACFDTAFHRHHPWVNDTFGLPRSYYQEGIRRYGFHGLSYTYITQALDRIDSGHQGRTVVAHLGNGASICAIRDGHSVGSTMGFSALDGLPMGTRCGQLDPGVLLYMLESKGMNAADITDILYKQSGLLGLSGISNDVRTLEESDAPEAREALEYFVFRIRRELGAMAAILGGVDTLVFCGGIGENSAYIREQTCAGMGWMGIALDPEKNAANAAVISTSDVTVRVIPTDEERVIAQAVFDNL